MKKRLLFISSALDIGGVQRSLLNLLLSLDPEAYEIDLMLYTEGGALEAYLPRNVKLAPFPKTMRFLALPRHGLLHAFRQSFGPNLNAIRFLYYLLKGILSRNMGAARQQLAYACRHTLPPVPQEYEAAIDYSGNYKGILLSHINAARKISWVHGDYRTFSRDRTIDRLDYAQLTSIITVSNTCKSIFDDVFPEFSQKTYVMQNITQKSLVHALSLAETDSPAWENDDQSILDISRLDPDKGLELAIAACSILVHRGRNIRWYILGDGPQRSIIQKMIAEHELDNTFILLGSHSNPYPSIRQADMIVHCSRFEGRSVAIDEAMLLGKPIIVTNYPTAKDQITHGVTGLICAMEPDDIADTIEQLIDDASLRSTLTRNLERFNLPAEASLGVFRKIIG